MQVAAQLEEWREANPNAKAGAMPDAVRDRLKEIYGEHLRPPRSTHGRARRSSS
jgi:hypothetical protein